MYDPYHPGDAPRGLSFLLSESPSVFSLCPGCQEKYPDSLLLFRYQSTLSKAVQSPESWGAGDASLHVFKRLIGENNEQSI
jgi:hypothetical protein